ncbi:hypothetical protein BDY19DRAFT_932756 [Irpex rosettiformis]|uniref:Uncharacterized protein n=1 Tax=Irpex rosettiformis TaxID=378272 RepID=A0ACB8U9V2_9APHY|nr:hypothetical protein BDY19DRAFT_932756 [Irpex rosettiformis]
MDATEPIALGQELGWSNVALAFSFILFNALISRTCGLELGNSLIVAAVRCILQLSLVAVILQRVFETDNAWAVAGIAFMLNLMGATEVVVNKAKRRHQHMFLSVLVAMLGSTVPVSIIGARFSMSVLPFWSPSQYVPIVGMLCGSTVSAIVIAVNFILRELHENKDRIETRLAFGATRFEACKPVAVEALRLALTPCINQMSVLGIIAIPGMMTGAILGGSSVTQAARLQTIIIFMISSSTALSSIIITLLTLNTVVDGEHRVRPDRVDHRPHAVWRARDWVSMRLLETGHAIWSKICSFIQKQKRRHGIEEDKGAEMEELLQES